MIEQITSRLLKNWKTAIVSIVLFALPILAVHFDYMTAKESVGYIAAIFAWLLKSPVNK